MLGFTLHIQHTSEKEIIRILKSFTDEVVKDNKLPASIALSDASPRVCGSAYLSDSDKKK